MTPSSGRTGTARTAPSPGRGRGLVAALLAAPLAVAACTPGDVISPPRAAAGELTDFSSCDELLDYFQENALEQVGPWGFGSGAFHGRAETSLDDSPAGGDSADAASGAALGTGPGDDFSGTNNQEVGVEEPDIVQTDGEVILTVRGGELVVVDVAAGEKVGSLRLPGLSGDAELLLDREQDRALVLAREWPGTPQPLPSTEGLGMVPAFPTARTVVTLVDLSDPGSPVASGSIRLEGDYRSARMHDGAARVVMVTEPPGLAFTQPRNGSLAAENAAEQANRAIIEDSTLDDWLPHLQRTGAEGTGQDGPELAVPCEQIARPGDFSGLSTMSVLTFDLDESSLNLSSSTGLVATGSTVYASTDRLVVATSPWEVWPVDRGGSIGDTMIRPAPVGGAVSTALHTFDLTDPDGTAYLASGSVDGRLLNQFSLDETDGVIRVATTQESEGETPSSSSLLVLTEEDGRLVEQGRVDGLGETERIYAVRYLSADLAAIVTFRETDPLYLVDTSDPTAPEVTGELKIPGYSAYLHPIGEDRVLGIGQDATETGVTTGLQVSIFDVSDPANPTQVAKQTWADHSSEAEHEHRAVRYWPRTGQLLLPAYAWTEDGNWNGVVSASVDGSTLNQGPSLQLGSSTTGTWDRARRILVIGEQVWVLGERSLTHADLATLERRGEVTL